MVIVSDITEKERVKDWYSQSKTKVRLEQLSAAISAIAELLLAKHRDAQIGYHK